MLNARELTEEETKTLKKKASEILSVCRRDVLTKYPFIGSIALRMEMVPVRDIRVRTACTDGNSVYFDIAFLSSLSKIVNNPASAFESHNMNFSMGQKDALSALAQYADRDDDLFDYIKKRAS